MIRFACPDCRATLKAAEEMAGRTLQCPNCRLAVLVPPPVRRPVALGAVLLEQPRDEDGSEFEFNDTEAVEHRRKLWPRIRPTLLVMSVLLLIGAATGALMWPRLAKRGEAGAGARNSPTSKSAAPAPGQAMPTEDPASEGALDRWALPEDLKLPPSKPTNSKGPSGDAKPKD